MPALRISIDAVTIATVCTDGCDVLTLRAAGTRIEDDLATLDMSGGSYPKDGKSTYLTWVNNFPLRPGQVVEVLFLENASSSHRGKTIEELFPDEASVAQNDFKPAAEIFAELRARPKLHDKFSFRATSSSGVALAKGDRFI